MSWFSDDSVAAANGKCISSLLISVEYLTGRPSSIYENYKRDSNGLMIKVCKRNVWKRNGLKLKITVSGDSFAGGITKEENSPESLGIRVRNWQATANTTKYQRESTL